jgi:hypothetical protein
MYDYIQIGAWRSDNVPDLHVLEWDAPLMPAAQRPHVTIPGRMSAAEDARRDWRPVPIKVNMALLGDSMAQLRQKYRTISRTLHRAEHLILSDMPAYHFRGHTVEVQVVTIYEEWMQMRLIFLANPPCLLRPTSQQTGYIPAAGTPIPEQLTDANASRALDATGTASMVISDGVAAYEPEIYLSITGTWQQLNVGLGGIILPAQTTSKTVYIDAEAQVAYTIESGIRTPVAGIRGDYTKINQGTQLTISGISQDIHVRMLAIERS